MPIISVILAWSSMSLSSLEAGLHVLAQGYLYERFTAFWDPQKVGKIYIWGIPASARFELYHSAFKVENGGSYKIVISGGR